MCSCEPLFPGDSEIDQLYIIQEGVGRTLPKPLLKFFEENKKYKGLSLPDPMLYCNDTPSSIMRRLIKQHPLAVPYFKQYNRLEVLCQMLELDPVDRCNCEYAIEFLENPDRFLPELKPLCRKSINQKKIRGESRKRHRKHTHNTQHTNSKQSLSTCNNLVAKTSNTCLKLSKLPKKSTLLTEILDEYTDSEDYGDDFEENYDYNKKNHTFLKKI
jgi:hypothetical protein